MSEVKQIGNIMPNKNRDNPNTGRVYDKNGLAPTLNCMQGGNLQPMIIEDFYKNREPRVYDETAPTIRAEREGLKVIEEKIVIGGMQKNQSVKTDGVCTTLTSSMGTGGGYVPMVVASRGRNPDNPSDRKQGIELEQRLEPNSEGICNTLTSVQKDNLVLENCYDFYNNKLRTDKCTGTITTNSNATGSGVFGVIEPTYRIRKLTPKECSNLMGFSKEDAEKMLEVNSNTQVYKQCGNSICVSVLEAIFCQMNIKDCPTWEERAKEEYL